MKVLRGLLVAVALLGRTVGGRAGHRVDPDGARSAARGQRERGAARAWSASRGQRRARVDGRVAAHGRERRPSRGAGAGLPGRDLVPGGRAERAQKTFEGDIDAERIGVFGISLGGITTPLVAFHPEWRDPRVAAAISIAGAGDVFGPRFFDHAAIPFLMIAGTADAYTASRR